MLLYLSSTFLHGHFSCCKWFFSQTRKWKMIVPMESVSLRLYSDAYPCHRVPTHSLISVIWNKPFFWPEGAPLSLAVIFVFQLNKRNQAPIVNGPHQLTLVLKRPVYNRCLKLNGVAYTTKRPTKQVAQLNSKQRSRDSMTSSLTWQVYDPGVGDHNYGYNRRTLAQSVSIDS